MVKESDDYIGMKLIEVNYTDVAKSYPYLSIFKDGVEVSFGLIGDVLKSIPHLKDEIVKESNTYFNALVLRV